MPKITNLALRRLVEKFLRAYEELDADFEDERLWCAYEDARAALGDPVKAYPGGYADHHVHPYGWKAADGCETCEDYQEEAA